MDTISVSKSRLGELVLDVEKLVTDFESLTDFDDAVLAARIDDVKSGKVKGGSEAELDKYLRKRGVKIE
jgi:hypothetical protein